MKKGYARTSTIEQVAGLEAQLRDLKAAGVKKKFQRTTVQRRLKRAQLEAAIDYCREGDVLVCTKLDRLARSVADVVKIEEAASRNGAALQIMDPAMDTSTPAGRLTFNVLASIAQFERRSCCTPARRHREGEGRRQVQGRRSDSSGPGGRDQGLHASNLKAPEIAASSGSVSAQSIEARLIKACNLACAA